MPVVPSLHGTTKTHNVSFYFFETVRKDELLLGANPYFGAGLPTNIQNFIVDRL
jgi:hypothetical protein